MKKLWETKAFSSDGEQSRTNKGLALFSTHLLTLLLGVFLLLVVCILGFFIYTSNGGGNKQESAKAFYNPSTSSSVPASSAPATETTPEPSETASSSEATGETLTVIAGEGAGQIAARAGITLERLYELNPDKMVGPGGTWWANPGDVVIVN